MNQDVSAMDEIRCFFGREPNLFQAYAHYPPLLEANWSKLKAVLLAGSVRAEVKEIIELQISRDNGCDYCTAAHAAVLAASGFCRNAVEEMLNSGRFPGLSDKEQALVRFARKANRDWREIDAEEIGELRQTGVLETEIIEVLGVVELFSGFSRLAKVAQIEADFHER